MPLFAGPGVVPNLRGNTTNVLTLKAGQVYPLSVPGWYETKAGPYTTLQEYDPIAQVWRVAGAGSANANLERIYSDGNNYRLANLTGCAVAAVVTTAGSGYVSAPLVTPSAGGSLWRAIVGGALNTVVTVTNGGSNYTYAPLVLIAAPPPGGVQATGYCTLTGGSVSSVTLTDQGAGYSAPPTFTFLNDPREGQNGIPTGGGAAASALLTGANTITAVVNLDPGASLTATPTLAFSGGGGTGAAATAIMCYTVTGYTVSAAGTGYPNAPNVLISALSSPAALVTPITSAILNPTIQQNFVKTRDARILAGVSGGAITVANQLIVDGGIFLASSTNITPYIALGSATPSAGSITGAATVVLTVGGTTDTSIVLTT